MLGNLVPRDRGPLARKRFLARGLRARGTRFLFRGMSALDGLGRRMDLTDALFVGVGTRCPCSINVVLGSSEELT